MSDNVVEIEFPPSAAGPLALTGIQIYVIGATRDGPLKIGISQNPWDRLAQLQSGHPARLFVYATYFIERRHIWLERAIHESLSECRLEGEWFALPIEAVINTIHGTHANYGLSVSCGEGWGPRKNAPSFRDWWLETVLRHRRPI